MAMRWLVLILVLSVAAASLPSAAQQPVPTARQVARIRVLQTGPVAFTAAGGQLAVGVGQQLQLFELSEPANPRDFAVVELSGPPLALGSTDRMTLVAVNRSGTSDEIAVIAPDPYRRGEVGIVNSLQTSDSVTHLLISPDNAWAVALSREGYVMLRLSQPDRIESSALAHTASPPTTGALLDDALLLAVGEDPHVDRLPLQLSHAAPTTTPRLNLDAPVVALAASPDGTLAAAALDTDQLILFDPVEMTALASVRLEDGPAAALHITAAGDRRLLVVQIANRPAVMLLDITDPQNVGLPGSAGLGPGSTIQTSAANGAWLALVGSDDIQLFELD